MSAETWRDLLPRLRYKDLGSGATFGHRDVAIAAIAEDAAA
jgi:hypothetical protein